MCCILTISIATVSIIKLDIDHGITSCTSVMENGFIFRDLK